MNSQLQQRIDKGAALQGRGGHFPYQFDVTHTNQQFLDSFTHLLETGEELLLAGRIMFRNRMGKVMFMRSDDASGRLQWMISRQHIGDDPFEAIKSDVDIGDICGVRGTAFRTKKGEPSVLVTEFSVLAKCVRPLPEKYHSLKDKELRYRHRELDLIMNRDVFRVFRLRSDAVSFMRRWMEQRGFLEVEIPTLQMIYGGAEAAPFKTHVNAIGAEAYLSISPELFLKRLIVGGFDKVFTLAKNFRNEGIDATHYPEFTSLESYEAFVDYNDVRTMTEDLLHDLCIGLHGASEVEYQGRTLSFAKPFKVVSYFDVLHEKTGLGRDVSVEQIVDYVKKELRDAGIDLSLDRPRLLDKVFGATVEPDLVQPTFVVDYPKHSTPLCRPKRDDPELIERFELYIHGMEVANAYSELNDPVMQRQLLTEQTRLSTQNKEIPPEADEDFMRAIEFGMPPTGGLGIGIDRIVMLLTDADSIREVILYPFMRPEATGRPPGGEAPAEDVTTGETDRAASTATNASATE